MRVFVAGATGVIGIPLVKELVVAGHDVAGMTRSASKTQTLQSLGVHPVVCDVYDAVALGDAIADFDPDAIVHELTDLPDDPDRVGDFRDANARIRREGTRNLLDAAAASGVTRFVAQSVAWPLTGDGGAAIEEHERAVLAFGGVVARYGMFYGPGTFHAGDLPDGPRVHVDDAARRTVPLLDAPSGVVVITD